MRRTVILLASFLALVLVLHVVSAPATGHVRGRVLHNHDPFSETVLSLVSTESGKLLTGRAATDGSYVFDGIPEGAYALCANRGPLAARLSPIHVMPGQVTLADVAFAAPEPPAQAKASTVPLPPPPPPTELTAHFAAPLEAPMETSGGVEGAVPGGVVGGVAGGVLGGVLGGTASAPPGWAGAPHRPFPYLAPYTTEAYDRIDPNEFRSPLRHPLSTFSVDVDTASYSNVRRFLNEGVLPPVDAVRIEELLNYFKYDYPNPDGDVPFAVTTQVGACPWDRTRELVLVGLQGRRISADALPPRNLVYLIDVSGSMMSPDKLPLLKMGLKMLTLHLTPADRVAIVVYAGASGVVLPATTGARSRTILDAIDSLEAGGSTNGGAGIQLAYRLAAEDFTEGGVNRVILATDGDFNVGTTDIGSLTRLIEKHRESGIFLSVLGFGTGNLKDATMERLADRGNGNYAYIDSIHEARRVLVSEAAGTLVTIAKDVKIQAEFNPKRVNAYRLVGYENRLLRDEDFLDDEKDAGEIGVGHTVTALFEIIPNGEDTPVAAVAPLRYQEEARLTSLADGDDLMTVRVRYKDPSGDVSREIVRVVKEPTRQAEGGSHALGFASAVAQFGMLLRGRLECDEGAGYGDVVELARRHLGPDAEGYRAEFVRLAELAQDLAVVSEVRKDGSP